MMLRWQGAGFHKIVFSQIRVLSDLDFPNGDLLNLFCPYKTDLA